MTEPPIVVLAFANEQEGHRYLRDLPEELRALQGILRDAEGHGLCRLELLPNATLDQIFEVFTRYRDRVTILHYAGHADSGQLLLESSVAGGGAAYAAGLATFLGQRRGLELVFLNGCSTRAQVAALLDAGVSSVIATARAIKDDMARAFATAFYTELTSGAPLRPAFEASRGRVLAAHGADPQAYCIHRDVAPREDLASPDPTDDRGFPWEFRPGTELVERWSLPDAAGNPEFGLPRVPERDLPESPFRHLAWFAAEHAEVFFGRGYQVREMYEQVTDPTGPPILLLYGASGVGKSSLLDAGLVPRLEAGGHAVRYRRRDGQKGLTGTLRDALGLAVSSAPLVEAWRAQEDQLKKPLVLFLDQVEEVFTRADAAQPHELDEFLTTLTDALGNRDARPQGKLVLGFRKEWLAEIDRRLAEAKLPRAKVFLKPLDRRGIIEAISGPARPGRLQRQYRLAIDDGLPDSIADNLLADAGSAVAPTLQVLLSKMWERARQANPDAPRFSGPLYEKLKAEGYLLKDVLDAGLKAIGEWSPAIEQSGLALDLLVYHTTEFGTAAQCTHDELEVRYAHQADKLDGLLARCKDHYLIIEAESLPDSPARATRLAHDLLAPLVQQRFRLSITPGQRARRLLENRAPEWQDGKTGPVLDSTDLATVEEGAPGMRAWRPEETRMIEASRLAEQQAKAQEQERTRRLREAEERQRQAEAEKQKETEQRLKEQKEAFNRLRIAAVALGAILVVAIGAAFVARKEYLQADKQTKIANKKTDEAKEAAGKEKVAADKAKAQTLLAEQGQRIANAQRLAALAKAHFDAMPQTALLLAIEAAAMLRPGDPYVAEPEQSLRDLLTQTGGKVFATDVRRAVFAGDRYVLFVLQNGQIQLAPADDPTTKRVTLGGAGAAVPYQLVSPDGSHALVTAGDGVTQLWRLTGPNPVPVKLPGFFGVIQSGAEFSRDSRQLVVFEGDARIWRIADTLSTPMVLRGQRQGSHEMGSFSIDGKRLVTHEPLVGMRVWKIDGTQPERLTLPTLEGFQDFKISPDHLTVVRELYGAALELWSLSGPEPSLLPSRLAGSEYTVFSTDGKLFATFDKQGNGQLHRLSDPATDPVPLPGRSAGVRAAKFSLDSHYLAVTDSKQQVRLWRLDKSAPQSSDMATRGDLNVLGGKPSFEFSPDSKHLLFRSEDKPAMIAVLGEKIELADLGVVLSRGGTFSSDSLRLVGEGQSPRTWLWRTDQLKPGHGLLLRGYNETVAEAAFSPNGSRLLTRDQDGTARLLDCARAVAEPLVLDAHHTYGGSAIGADGMHVVTVNPDSGARLWPLAEPGLKPLTLETKKSALGAWRFDSKTSSLLVLGKDGKVRRWSTSAPTAAPRDVFDARVSFESMSGEFSPDESFLVIQHDGAAKLWNLTDPKRKPVPLSRGWELIQQTSFSPNSRFLVTGAVAANNTYSLTLWKLSGPDPVSVPLEPSKVPTPNGAYWIAPKISADSNSLAIMIDHMVIPVWQLEKPEEKPTLLNIDGMAVSEIEISPDGKTIAALSGMRNRVHLLRVDRPKDKPVLLDSLEPTTGVRFSPDGGMLASISPDNRVHLLRLTDPQAGPVTLGSASGQAFLIGFSGDGRRLVTRDTSGQVQIWTIPEEDLLRMARETVGRELNDAERARFKVPRSPE